MTSEPFASEAPVICRLLRREDGSAMLERRLDPVFARSERARRAFIGEVEAAAALSLAPAQGLATVLAADAGLEPFLTRSFRPEGTLGDVIRAGRPVPVELVPSVVADLTRALDSLHRLGVTHGGVAPENVLLRAEGGVELADPTSSRAAFSHTPAANGEAAWRRDRAAVLPLARGLLSLGGSPGASDLEREIRSILDCTWEDERKLSALARLAVPSPAVLPATTAGQAPWIPFPVPVTISVAALPDPRARHAVARECAPHAGVPPHRVSKVLETGALTFPSVFPSPARALAATLAAAGARASIHAAGRGPDAKSERED